MKEETQVRKRRVSKAYTAKEKCRAVLAVWSGRRTPAMLCKEMDTTWAAVHGWEKTALEGIMKALDPGWTKEPREGIRLGKRVEKLLTETVTAPVVKTANG